MTQRAGARTYARELYGRCAAALPAVADALRDVRALEERLVAHQRAATEALEAIPGAVGGQAHAGGERVGAEARGR